MSSVVGDKIKVQLFGQAHSRGLGVVIDGLPAGEKIDFAQVNKFLARRAGGKNAYSTTRRESDVPEIISGVVDEFTCGAPLCAMFTNDDTKSDDYHKNIPRPAHADFTAHRKHHGFNDYRGGGHFSGRLTLPLCFAGAICLQILARRNIFIGAHISAIGEIYDTPFDAVNVTPNDFVDDQGFPTCDKNKRGAFDRIDASAKFATRDKTIGEQMIQLITTTAKNGDSLGGIIECAIVGMPVGCGEPIFANLESQLAYSLFAIPAVKGVEFGAGFRAATMTGKNHHDEFYVAENKAIKTRTNNAGGILGGLSNGMPIIFRTAFKPTPSIFLPQQSVDLSTNQAVEFSLSGRHDPCIVPRAVPCVEAASAIVIANMIL